MAEQRFEPALDAAAASLRTMRPGLSVSLGVLLGPDTVIREHGPSRVRETRRITSRTIFEIGSITKVFTGVLLAAAVAEGRAGLDESVASLMPALGDAARDLTLLRLASHTAGLPRLPRNLVWRSWLRHPLNPYAGYSEAGLVAAVRAYRGVVPTTPVATTLPQYSNFGVGLLGTALARRYGTTFEDAVVSQICTPLKLDDTRIALSAEAQSRLAAGHTGIGIRVPHWSMPGLEGAGALRSSMVDLLQFAAASVGRAPEPIQSAIRDSQTVRTGIYAADGRLVKGVGLGWHAFETTRSRRLIHWHNGLTYGSHSFVAVVPSLEIGVIVLTDRGPGLTDRVIAKHQMGRIAFELVGAAIRHTAG